MTGKIRLSSPVLSFVNTCTGKLHVRERANPRALCGQPIKSGAEQHPSWRLAEEHLCRKCANLLKRPVYQGMWQRESEAVV